MQEFVGILALILCPMITGAMVLLIHGAARGKVKK
jgi:hypothetical protein